MRMHNRSHWHSPMSAAAGWMLPEHPWPACAAGQDSAMLHAQQMHAVRLVSPNLVGTLVLPVAAGSTEPMLGDPAPGPRLNTNMDHA